MSTPNKIPWRPIEPLDLAGIPTNGSFASLAALHQEWTRFLNEVSEDDRVKIRQRSLRRLAVETGILEKLYEIEWGLTLTLVAEGFTRDVIERRGGRVDDLTLETLRSQQEGLEMVLDFVRSQRELSDSFIRELHAMLTRVQRSYVGKDGAGRAVEVPLEHGKWKMWPNSVERQDGTIVEYAPPEQVQSEIEHLIGMYRDLERSTTHPIVTAAWLHHRFVQIHPFADGNGRVARALTLLVLERHHYAPLVIDRFHREEYLNALDSANAGDLIPLNKLFMNLESAALAGELERPEPLLPAGLSIEVAHTLADQLVALRRRRSTEIQIAMRPKAIAVEARIRRWFEHKSSELRQLFDEKRLTDVVVVLKSARPGDVEARWFKNEVIQSARLAGHYANFSLMTSWSRIALRTRGLRVRYFASMHGAGRDAGVMAVTTFGDIAPFIAGSQEPVQPTLFQTTKDAFRFVHTESVEDISRRAPELEDLLDTGLSVALAHLMKQAVR